MKSHVLPAASLLLAPWLAGPAGGQSATNDASSTLPSGTVFEARLSAGVCTHTNSVGDRLAAQIPDSGSPALLRGAAVTLVLIRASEAAGADQSPVLDLAAQSVRVGERTLPLTVDSIATTVRVVRRSAPARKGTAPSVGGSAVAGAANAKSTGGAVLGAVAGAARAAHARDSIAAASLRHEGCMDRGSVIRLRLGEPLTMPR